jgi:penicillin-binding protein 1A
VHPEWRRKIKRALLIVTAAIGLAVVAGVIAALWVIEDFRHQASKFDLKAVEEVAQRSAVYDIDGQLLSYVHGENRIVVPLDRVSPLFISALIAREDARFYEHHGIDYKGIARAVVRNISAGGLREGASTITQQLARNSFHLREKSFRRKLLEAMLAQRLERTFSKDQILEHYVNRIYFGSGLYGIETAAKAYFGKPAADLNLSEAALLAGLIRNPTRFSPMQNLPGAIAERDTVLDRMSELGMISNDQANKTRLQNVFVARKRTIAVQESYVMDAVRRDLETVLSPEQIDAGGLKIYTSLDATLQKTAENALEAKLREVERLPGFPHAKREGIEAGTGSDFLQGALIAIDNRTGGIRAIVGGRDYEASKFDRALLSRRQVGSTFKPFVYAAAFARGLMPGTLVSDDKIAPGEFKTIVNDWSPANSDDEYMGMQPAALGLIKSRNTMSVRIGEYAGLNEVRRLARLVGLAEELPDLPVIYLGGFETTLKQLTASYMTFANSGARKEPFLITRIDDADDNVVFRSQPGEAQVIAPEIAWMTSALLEQVMKSGTAAKARSLGWSRPAAGKTGTTNDFHDAWFIGYTTSLTCGVWVGFDQPQPIMEKGYASTLALPVWVEFMKGVSEKEYPARALPVPSDVRAFRLCSVSGKLATPGCDAARASYDVQLHAGRAPVSPCPIHPVAPPPLVTESAIPPAEVAVQPAPVTIASSVNTAPPPVAAAPLPAATPVAVRRAQPAAPPVGVVREPEPVAAAPVETPVTSGIRTVREADGSVRRIIPVMKAQPVDPSETE